VVVGDALLDRDLDGRVNRVAPDAPAPVVEDLVDRPRPGGAALAATLLAADGEDQVVLVTATAADSAGTQLRELLAAAGVTVIDLGLAGETPQKVRVRAAGHPLLRLDHGGSAPSPVGEPGPAVAAALDSAAAVLVSDYGRGVADGAALRELLTRAAAHVPVVWDPHPKGRGPVPGVRLATPNAAEAARSSSCPASSLPEVAAAAATLRTAWQAASVVVTLGARGALVDDGSAVPLVVPAPAADGRDPCGAGDRFAAAAARLLAAGALTSEAVTGAVASASAFVGAGGASAWRPRPDLPAPGVPAVRLGVVEQVRAAGGTLVATGGCFDLLHAGHVSLLQSARSLGDALVVLLNSDESVRRLKGSDRPLQPARDRAAVLRALASVDEVLVFDEDTPEQALRALRPQVWVKGGDYALGDLPEAGALGEWGGQAVLVPYLAGRSTTALLDLAREGGLDAGARHHP